MSANNTVFKIVTDQIIDSLNKGIIPWRKPWKLSNTACNLISKKPYKGFNRWFLNSLPYSSRYYLTFNQCKQIGGMVKKGSKGYPVIFWKFIDYKQTVNGEEVIKKVPLLRYYTVFNTEQCDNIPDSKIPVNGNDSIFEPISQCELIVNSYTDKPNIVHGSDRACYIPAYDVINMPNPTQFNEPTGYYATLFHELGHSTGHETRLNRKLTGYFGSDTYAYEELIAELSSSYLCAQANIDKPVIENTISYIQTWLTVFKNEDNVKMLVYASGAAEKAVNYILKTDSDIDSEIESE